MKLIPNQLVFDWVRAERPEPRKSFRKIPVKIGDRFGMLTVTSSPYSIQDENGKFAKRLIECECDCGKTRTLVFGSLCSGNTKSCGCYQKDRARQTQVKHGAHSLRQSDGRRSRDRLYEIWAGMKRRCRNKNDESYKNYGGRGIKICQDWLSSFSRFASWAEKNGYCEDLTIDRVDNDGDYEPLNCRWSDRKTQNRNRRATRFIVAFGETKSLAAWVEDERCSVCRGTLIKRLNHGWPPAEAIVTPPFSRVGNNRKL